MAFQKKRCQVNGVRYATRTKAIEALLVDGWRKCDIAKKISANYSFIVTIQNRMLEKAPLIVPVENSK